MGRAWVFGDHVNTDLITPGRYNLTTEPKELARICFCEVRPEFAQAVAPGDFVVAGEHFGSGSSRESAALALRACGLRAVVARSFARIFYRNALNVGLLALIAPTEGIVDGDELELDLDRGALHDRTRGMTLTLPPVPRFVLELERAGGIVAYLNRHGGRWPAFER